MSAAKKADRPIVCIPAALKCFYLDDPTEELKTADDAAGGEPPLAAAAGTGRCTSASIASPKGCWPSRNSNISASRRPGPSPSGRMRLAEAVVGAAREAARRGQQRGHHSRTREGGAPGGHQGERAGGTTPEAKSKLASDMDDLFFVIQLFSYPGDYVAERPTIERIAETLDKFEEDVLRADFPGIRGRRGARRPLRRADSRPQGARSARRRREHGPIWSKAACRGCWMRSTESIQQIARSVRYRRPKRFAKSPSPPSRKHDRTVNVAKSFGSTQVLQPTTLRLTPGETTVLIGPSGCGKSTLLRLMIGLIEPDQGEVLFDGTPLTPQNVMLDAAEDRLRDSRRRPVSASLGRGQRRPARPLPGLGQAASRRRESKNWPS